MKMTGNSRMQSLISLVALSIGLCFASPTSADTFLLDSSGKVLSEIGRWVVEMRGIPPLASMTPGSDRMGQYGCRLCARFHHRPNGVGMTDLGTLGGNSSTAAGINDAGRVVGRSTSH